MVSPESPTAQPLTNRFPSGGPVPTDAEDKSEIRTTADPSSSTADQRDPGDRFDASLPRTAIGAAVIAGVALRVWLLNTPLGRVDPDEASVGLMAQATLEGNDAVFFNYQSYGGTQEIYFIAALFKVFGPSVLALKLVSIALHALASILAWRIARRLIGERAAQLGALATWVFPGALMWWSTKAGCFYGFTLVCGLVVMLSATRLAARPHWRDALAIGAASGLGVWASPQIVYFLLPTFAWLVVTRWRSAVKRPAELARLAGVALAAGVVGAFPWLIWNISHDWSSLDTRPSEMSHIDRLDKFINDAFPASFGLHLPYTNEWVIPVFSMLLYVAVGVALVWTIVRRRNAALLSTFVVAYALIFAALPQHTMTIMHPRYLYYLAPGVLLLLAVPLRRFAVPVLAVLAISSATTVAYLRQLPPSNPYYFTRYMIVPNDIGPVVDALDARGTTLAYAPYRWAYRISFETDQRITATPIELLLVRDREIADKVNFSPDPAAYVFRKGGSGDQAIQKILADGTIVMTRVVADEFVVYFPSEKVLPGDLPGLKQFGLD
jgi:hypothetical protein